jgi:hypothetical protein
MALVGISLATTDVLPLSAAGIYARPSDVSGLNHLYETHSGIVLGGTLLASGAAPPVVTMTGALAQSLPLRVEIQTTGARGTATFRWSINSGTTWAESNVVTAATYLMPGTGIALNFPAGTYTNNNVFEATIASWADQAGSATMSQATAANQPALVVDAATRLLAARFDQVNDTLGTAAIDWGTRTTATIVCAVRKTSGNGGAIVSKGNPGAVAGVELFVNAVPNSVDFYITRTTGTFDIFSTNGGQPAGANYVLTLDVDADRASTVEGRLFVNGAAMSMTNYGNVDVDHVGSNTPIYMGARTGSAAFFGGSIHALAVYDRVLTDEERLLVEAYMRRAL